MASQARPVLWIGLGLAFAVWALSRTKEGTQIALNLTDAIGNALIAPRGIRNNNPGNLVRTGDAWQGMSSDQSTDARFVVFDAPVWGLRAMARVLRNYLGAGQTTVREIVARWAPSSENDTGAYMDAVAAALGVGVDDQVAPAQLPELMAAIIKHENGMQPYPPALFDQAIALERTA